MVQRISDRVNPWRLAEQGETVNGQYALDSFPRLASVLDCAQGGVSFELRFRRDRQKRVLLETSVEATLVLQCQRCLGSMEHAVETEGTLALVQGLMEAEQLPGELDPLLLQENELLLIHELIEDELLLSIPASPRHDEDCGSPGFTVSASANELKPPKDNPFAMLASLKTGKNDS